MEKLKKQNSPAAATLSKRISVIEVCQILAFKKAKTLPRQDLASHLALMQAQSIELPVTLRLDVFERQADDLFHDYFSAESVTKELALSLAKMFEFWDGEADLDDCRLHLGAVLKAEEKYQMKRCQSGEILEEESTDSMERVFKAS